MHLRKIQQIKTYSKIIKYKKKNGQIEELKVEEEHPQSKQEHPEQELQHEDFQDPVEDQFEEEEEWVSEASEEEEGEEEEPVNQSGTMMSEHPSKPPQEMLEEPEEPRKEVYMGNNKTLKKGQILEFDNKAYDMLHRLNVEWPSMTIDFVARGSPFDGPLPHFQQMNKYPYNVFTVQGSCNNTDKNSIYFMKWSNLCQTKYDDDPEGNEDDQDPEIVIQEIQTTFDVNRIRTLGYSPIVAFWNDYGHGGQIRIMDLSTNLEKLNQGISSKRREKGKEIVIPMEASGFGLAWNPHKVGELVVGDNNGKVSVLCNNANYTEWSKSSEYMYHKGSVEDIVFSPEQSYVFASCSSDGTLQIVDMRSKSFKKAQLKIKAHTRDVNVCDWSSVATHLVVTGADDCAVKVWDLRMIGQGVEEEVLSFNWHTEPITSVKFQPKEESVIAVASQDNRVSLWDMSMQNQEADPEVPNELLFVHQGQQEIKQICFHPVYYQMLATTSIDAVNLFKPALEMPEEEDGEKGDRQDLARPPVRQSQLDKFLGGMKLQ